MEQKTNQAKQEPVGSTAETGALHDEEIKDVAGGGVNEPVRPPANRGVFRCPHCGWSRNYVFTYAADGTPSCRVIAQIDHDAATNGSCTEHNAVVLDETTKRKHYFI